MADVTLKLTIGSFSVEVTGPAEYAEKKLDELANRYLGSSRQPPAGGRPVPISFGKGGKKLAAGEFLNKVRHRNQPDRGLALGYFLEKVEGQENFATGELGDLARKSKYPFGNPSDVVTKLVSRGLMMSAGEKEGGQRAYALTASGEEYVESMLEAKS